MEDYIKNRPRKKFFEPEEIKRLRDLAIEKIKSKFLPDNKIIKIVLFGSSINNTFGEYESPGFRGSLFSDFDFIVFVEDDYEIPQWLNRQIDVKPFPDDKVNLAYRNKNFIENKYDVEIFFVKRKHMEDPKIQEFGELPETGIPMTPNSKHKHIVVYP